MSASCHQEGVVSRVESSGKTWVSIRRAEACRACSAQSACLALGGRVEELELEVGNVLEASPGDRVRLALPEADVVTASILVYLVPAAALLCGALAGSRIARAGLGAENPVALLGAVLGLLLGLAASRVIDRRATRGSRYSPRVTAVVAHDSRGIPTRMSRCPPTSSICVSVHARDRIERDSGVQRGKM